jgi:5-methylcytosine-specific restriction enzyme subunit McrC
MDTIKQYQYWEHHSFTLPKLPSFQCEKIKSKYFAANRNVLCYAKKDFDEHIKIEIGYYVGVDWLVENHSCIQISPKLNSRLHNIKEHDEPEDDIEVDSDNKSHTNKDGVFIDYFTVLNKCLTVDFLYKEINDLVQIDWYATGIPIEQEKDLLSPLLIVKFLNLLGVIVRKGLKKSYYQTRQNLHSKIKGKILIGENIKRNVLKNKLISTYCQVEEFGIDSLENRLLKKAFVFAAAYMDNYRKVFKYSFDHVGYLINYCRPAFNMVSEDVNINDVKNYKPNPFFKEYSEGIHLGKLILKRYSYSISNIIKEQITTPPYWIDMPKLFELYTYYFLKQRFPVHKEVDYHFRTYGNELDFLINSDDIKMVVDAKYKPLYIYGKNHNDIRQVAGYARLEKTYGELKLDVNKVIDCLIVYPDVENGCKIEEFITKNLTDDSIKIKEYSNVYKVGIKLPVK